MNIDRGQTNSMHAKGAAMVGLSHDRDMAEHTRARGRFHAKLTIPYKDDLPEFIRLRDEIARLERTALMGYKTMSTQQRIDLYAKADELRKTMDSIDQRVVYDGTFPNTVATVGKNLVLDQSLAGSAYTVTGPYMGLISSTSYSATAAADTMSSHAGWLEAGSANAPTYSGTRKTMAWSSASAGAKALSSALSFSITGTGTIKGCFALLGSGALSTVDNTAGTLLSAGTFTGGDQPVVNGNTVNVSYTLSL